MIHFLTVAGVVYSIETYRYLVMFILMLIEGPIVTYVAAFLASMGFFHIYWVLTLSVLGSLIPDVFFFMVGRRAPNIKVLKNENLKIVKVLQKIISNMDRHPGKSIAIIKLVPGLPLPGFILSGRTKIKFIHFLKYVFIVGIPYALVFTFLGYYSGLTFSSFSKYLKIGEIALAAIFVIFVLIFYFVNKMSPKIANKLEKSLED